MSPLRLSYTSGIILQAAVSYFWCRLFSGSSLFLKNIVQTVWTMQIEPTSARLVHPWGPGSIICRELCAQHGATQAGHSAPFAWRGCEACPSYCSSRPINLKVRPLQHLPCSIVCWACWAKETGGQAASVGSRHDFRWHRSLNVGMPWFGHLLAELPGCHCPMPLLPMNAHAISAQECEVLC